jgi:drug/metabolite transporter (DMT)-like permease
VTVFAERPDAATLLGSAVIVGSGIYTLLRSRRVQAMATQARPSDADWRQDRT